MHRHAYWLTLLLSATGAIAQTVEITATRERARQLDTAAITVVAREELLRYGDQTIADALKRVPGITIGAGEIRMRGLGNGYTQVLLNGQPVPAGFSIDTISPELIERVEVMRVASAELGTQAIAGTINIVLRRSAARTGREFKAGLAESAGQYTPDASGQVSGKGAGWNYTLGAVAAASRTQTDYADDELGFDSAGALNLRRRTHTSQLDARPSINITPRISWTLPNGDTLTSQNFVRMMRLDLRTRAADRTFIGEPTPFPDNETVFRAHAQTVRSDLQWVHQQEAGGRLEVKLGRNRFQRRATNTFSGLPTLADTALVRVVDSSADEDNATFGGKFSSAPAGGHTFIAGWDGAYGWRTEKRFEHLRPGDTVTSRGEEIHSARLDRIALFAQDDWSITPALSLSSGLRWEALRTRTGGNGLDEVAQNSHVLSPLMQALYKLSDSQQLRAGLTRTFKMPTLANLAMRRYTVDNNNSPIAPDMQGNPRLLPERAWGLDLAYERYFGKAAMLSASAYGRRIDDVTIERVEQVGTSWISTPVNAGRAKTWGVEFEAKFPLRPVLDLRASLARNWSHVDSIPGPDNRLPSQAPLSASAGVDHRLAAVPVTLGASFSFQGGGPVRLSERSGTWKGVRRDLAMYALWRIDARSQWRMSAANLLGEDQLSSASFDDQPRSLRTNSGASSAPTIRLAFEHKLGD